MLGPLHVLPPSLLKKAKKRYSWPSANCPGSKKKRRCGGRQAAGGVRGWKGACKQGRCQIAQSVGYG